jgi:hypothetical protein
MPDEPKKDAPNKGEEPQVDKPDEAKPKAEDFITKDSLKDSLKAVRSQLKKDMDSAISNSLKEMQGGLKGLIVETVTETLDTFSQPKEDKEGKDTNGKKVPDPSSLEITNLKRQLRELEKKHTEAVTKAEASESNARKIRKRTKTLEALVKAGCTKPDRVYNMLEGEGILDVVEDEVFVIIHNDLGGEDKLSIEEFAMKELRSEIVPELFAGANRSGSPAQGESASQTKSYRYDWNKVKQKPEVVSDPKFLEAVEAGQVANYPGS